MAAAGGAVTVLVLVSFWKLHGLLLASGAVATQTRVLDGYSSGFPLSNLWFTLGGSMAWAPAGSWVRDAWFQDRSGHRVTAGLRPLGNLSPAQQRAWLTHHGVSLWISYQPARHFWPLQGLESGVALALAVALGAVTVLLVRHRRA